MVTLKYEFVTYDNCIRSKRLPYIHACPLRGEVVQSLFHSASTLHYQIKSYRVCTNSCYCCLSTNLRNYSCCENIFEHLKSSFHTHEFHKRFCMQPDDLSWEMTCSHSHDFPLHFIHPMNCSPPNGSASLFMKPGHCEGFAASGLLEASCFDGKAPQTCAWLQLPACNPCNKVVWPERLHNRSWEEAPFIFPFLPKSNGVPISA